MFLSFNCLSFIELLWYSVNTSGKVVFTNGKSWKTYKNTAKKKFLAKAMHSFTSVESSLGQVGPPGLMFDTPDVANYMKG